MKKDGRRIGAADRRLLPEGRLAGPMPWVLAIMMFLTVLAAAAGLGLGSAAAGLNAAVGDRVSIQIMDANPDAREADAGRAMDLLQHMPGVKSARRLSPAEINRLLEPWLGTGGSDADLPIPAMIDADLGAGGAARIDEVREALTRAVPSARLDRNGDWLGPLSRLISSLKWLAAVLVLMMIAATSATVVLAARAALDMHRGTIEVLHLMGATDLQVARLFQRRIALDALFGGGIGLVGAALVLLLIGTRVAALGSDLIGSASLPVGEWLLLVALPVLGVLLAMVVARATILRALGRML